MPKKPESSPAERFNKYRKKGKAKLSYEQLRKLLAKPTTGLKEIAAMHGVTLEGMRLIYNKHFAAEFGLSSDRTRAYLEYKKAQRRKQLKNIPLATSQLQIVARRAKQYGCKVRAVPRVDAQASKGSLLLGGKVYRVHVATRIFSPRENQQYARFSLAPVTLTESLGGIICYCAIPSLPERYYVIPRSVLESLTAKRPKVIYLYVSFMCVRSKLSHPNFNIETYRDAWHLKTQNPEG